MMFNKIVHKVQWLWGGANVKTNPKKWQLDTTLAGSWS